MRNKTWLSLLFFCCSFQMGNAQTISYSGKLHPSVSTVDSVNLYIAIVHDLKDSTKLFVEEQKIKPDQQLQYTIEIGAGKLRQGDFQSINWSDGDFYLLISTDSFFRNSYNALIRSYTEIKSDNLEGMATADTAKDHGVISIMHQRGIRPRKVTADLTSSYVNMRYPADTYPIYRHFEWSDEDRDGKGNGFALTYSDHTTHAIFESGQKMGEVKLYNIPFQELLIQSNADKVILTLTRPVPISNFSQTYAVKGPWKIIYYLEW
ncbi:MAG: hypothetical protein V9E88_17550 [Ferruginibacter sp.]